MFKKVITLVLAQGIFILSFAQVDYGFKVGATHATTNNMSTADSRYINGYQFGGFADVKLSKNLSVRPGLQFTQKGHNIESNIQGGPSFVFYFQNRLALSYLEIPVDIMYSLPLSKAVKLYLGAGPTIGYGIAGKNRVISIRGEAANNYEALVEKNNVFDNPNTRRMDIGANLTAGVEFKNIFIGTSYNHGFINTFKSDPANNIDKNRTFALSVSYFLKRK